VDHSKRFDLKPPTPKYNFHQEVESIFELKRSVFLDRNARNGSDTALFLSAQPHGEAAMTAGKKRRQRFMFCHLLVFSFFITHICLFYHPTKYPKDYCEMI